MSVSPAQIGKASDDAFVRFLRDHDVPREWREWLFPVFRYAFCAGSAWSASQTAETAASVQQQLAALRQRVEAETT